MAFRYLCANTHPDHDSINAFRKRFLTELKGLFVDILVLAKTMGTLKLGMISLDGTKIKANASKHKALSWKYTNQLESQLKNEVEELMQLAEQADNRDAGYPGRVRTARKPSASHRLGKARDRSPS
jgi:ribosomal protein L29